MKAMTPRTQKFTNMTFVVWISSSSKLKSSTLVIYLNIERGKKIEHTEQGNT